MQLFWMQPYQCAVQNFVPHKITVLKGTVQQDGSSRNSAHSIDFIKGRGAAAFRKISRPPSCESPLKIPRHLIQELAIRHLMAKCALTAHCAVRRTLL
jgi:hypothetical protein